MQPKSLLLAALAVAVQAQRPSNTSVCDYYTTALLKNNTAANQMTLLTLVVNTAVIGNYTTPNVGITVPGILANGTVNGTAVNLLPYFSGGLVSTNRNGSATAVNFLDDGGAAPLKMNKPADGTSSRQYRLLTHLYEYFGTLLGCTMQGSDAYPAYAGSNSMYNVHKFMALNNAEVTYFIQQVGLSAASFGVAEADVTFVGNALHELFGLRCAPSAVVIPSQPSALQAICIESDCPEAPTPDCNAYDARVVEPSSTTLPVTSTPTATSGSGGSGSGGQVSATSSEAGAATAVAGMLVMGAAAVAAFV